MIPITALLAAQRFHVNTLERLENESCTTQRIIDTETALLVSTENKSRTELLIEITDGQFYIFQFARGIEKRKAPALKVLLKTGHRMLQKFEPGACCDILAHHVNFGIGVRQAPIAVVLST